MGRRPCSRWFAFDVDDWLDSDAVNKMSEAQQGLYIRMLALAWKREGACLPADIDELAKLVRPRRRKDLLRVVELSFECSTNALGLSVECSTNALRLFNKRLTNELRRSMDRRTASRKGAKTTNSRYGAPYASPADDGYGHRSVSYSNSTDTIQDRIGGGVEEVNKEVVGSPEPPDILFSSQGSEEMNGSTTDTPPLIVPAPPNGKGRGIEERIFAHWVAVMGVNPAKTRFTKERRTKIRARLDEKYSEQDLIAAIDGCRKSRWHMGENRDGKRFNGLTVIFRSGEQVEKFRDVATPPPVVSPPPRPDLMLEHLLATSKLPRKAEGF